MEEILNRVWENLIGRPGGRLNFRLLIQPAMALFFAIRAGLRDGRQGRTPYFWDLLFNRANRKDLMREGWKDIGKLLIIAIIIDVVYQLIVSRGAYILETLIVALVLAILPYVMVRGLVGRLSRRWRRNRNDVPTPEI